MELFTFHIIQNGLIPKYSRIIMVLPSAMMPEIVFIFYHL
jgi:hypothetical protein